MLEEFISQSENIEARGKEMKVVGLTGKTGGLLAGMVDSEIHIKILHILVLLIEQEVF